MGEASVEQVTEQLRLACYDLQRVGGVFNDLIGQLKSSAQFHAVAAEATSSREQQLINHGAAQGLLLAVQHVEASRDSFGGEPSFGFEGESTQEGGS